MLVDVTAKVGELSPGSGQHGGDDVPFLPAGDRLSLRRSCRHLVRDLQRGRSDVNRRQEDDVDVQCASLLEEEADAEMKSQKLRACRSGHEI